MSAVGGLSVVFGELVWSVCLVILLWLWGGLSYLDTFDPKFNVFQEICGLFSMLVTWILGLYVIELFPWLVSCSDWFSVIRLYHNYMVVYRVVGSIVLLGGKGVSGDLDYGSMVGSIV